MEPYIQTFIAAMTPIGELRLAIPLGLASFGLSASDTYITAILGNMIPVIFLLLFLEPVSMFLIQHSKYFEKFFNWIFSRTHKKVIKHYEVYGYLALVIFVAIPLPITGAWTGTVAAYLCGIPFWRAFWLITLGISISGLLVMLASISLVSII